MRILDIIRRKKMRSTADLRQKGVIYEVPCGKCDMVYVGETKKRLQERLKQHKDDVRLRRDTNAVFKHVSETGHEANWDGATVVEHECRQLVRKWQEARRVRELADKVMNWNSGYSIAEE